MQSTSNAGNAGILLNLQQKKVKDYKREKVD